ncbi:unnamed protein product [Cyclocybe aegerita]|uniref:Uncharacterized protein n=1 Tax=Cyclocybe aegerita TaxID=1973307 RepID=A0A8S0VT81_CYCAE|nr:unnamed protein product [Cyclocybe aegerita]
MLLRHIALPTEVENLTVACYPSDDWRMFRAATPFVDAAFAAHGPQLRHLKFNTPLEVFGAISSQGPAFPLLEELNIALRIVYRMTDYAAIIPELAAFINQHSSSLSSLTIDTPDAKVDLVVLSRNLGHLPRLTKVLINHPIDSRNFPRESTGIDAFLKKPEGPPTVLFRTFSRRRSSRNTANLLASRLPTPIPKPHHARPRSIPLARFSSLLC